MGVTSIVFLLQRIFRILCGFCGLLFPNASKNKSNTHSSPITSQMSGDIHRKFSLGVTTTNPRNPQTRKNEKENHP